MDCVYGKLKYCMWGLGNPVQVGKWLWGRGEAIGSLYMSTFEEILLLHSLVLYD